jgi:ubiquinone/menaquinone biosynthesis C-methylase UbiE/uncharacterized protein YbaR (Trm112 family)
VGRIYIMKKTLVLSLVCVSCRKNKLKVHAFSKSGREIIEGIIKCSHCNHWYIIHEKIPEMLIHSLNSERKLTHYRAYMPHFKKLKIPPPSVSSKERSQQKIHQSEFFDEFSENYVLETQTFWRAYYHQVLSMFSRSLHSRSVILDIGCGNGLSSYRLLEQGHAIIGVDISREMVKGAYARLEHHPLYKGHYVVADAENLPFKDNLFDACIGFGILHHVSSPEKSVAEISRCLKKEGLYVGHENNKTLLRPIFDALMKVIELWHEEAGDHQLFTKKEFEEYGYRNGLQMETETRVFLPPHLFNLLPYRAAVSLMRATDRIFQALPLIKNQGGSIIAKAKKK